MLSKLSLPAALLLLASAIAVSPTASATCTVIVLGSCGTGPCDPTLAIGCGSRDCLVVVATACPSSSLNTTYCNNTDPDDVILLAAPGLVVGVDTGPNGSRVLCVNNTGIWLDTLGSPGSIGEVVQLKLCTGTSCTTVIGITGAGVGPGSGLSCTIGICVFVWVNGVQVLP